MATSKVTIAENYATVKAFLEQNGADQALVDFIVDRAEKSKRATSDKAKEPTAEQTALRQAIIDTLRNSGVAMSVTELQHANPVLGVCSTSKITGNIGTMLTNGKKTNENGVLVRSVNGKTAKFSLA